MSTSEVRIQVAVPDGYEFDKFDPEKGEAVYKKKVDVFEMKRAPEGCLFFYVNGHGALFENQDLRTCSSQDYAKAYNYDTDKVRCLRRAARERARRKLEYIADQLNPEDWSPVTARTGWTIRYDDDSFGPHFNNVSGDYIVRLNEIYFHSEEAAQTAVAAMTEEELRALSLTLLP